MLVFMQTNTQFRSATLEEETILWHSLWKSWRKIRRQAYKLFRVNNTEELLGLVKSNRLSRKEFLSKIRRYVEISQQDIDEVKILRNNGVRIISIFDDTYPTELTKMKNPTERIYPPLILYHIGTLINFNKKIHVAIVGTRRCSKKGYEFAKKLGETLASKGYVIVNGLAKGIDHAATIGALNANGFVVGVRPWLDVIDKPPRYLIGILRKLLQKGCVISENAFKEEPHKWVKMQFQLRNRIIAGMSQIIVIVEARKPGGSMHQIEYALKRGKQVLIWSPKAKYHREFVKAHEEFVKMGAIRYETIDDAVSHIEKNIV